MTVNRKRTAEQLVVSNHNNPKKVTLAGWMESVEGRLESLAPVSPAPYSEVPADIAAALVAAGLMAPEPEGE